MPQERWRSPSSLSEQELRRMQQDAQKRVERMRRQANEVISRRPEPPQKPSPKPPEPSPPQNDPLAPVRTFLQDEERLMLLILLYLLYREKADSALLLALVYLIL